MVVKYYMMGVVDKFLILNTTNPSYIITWADVDIVVTENLLQKYIHEICEKNPILLQKISLENNKIVSKKLECFDFLHNYELRYVDCCRFSSCIDELLNTRLNTCEKDSLDWVLVSCVDKTKHVSRIYLKINHNFCDGYMLAKILRSSSVLDKNQEVNKIIEPSYKILKGCLYDKIYYHTIGLILLFFINLKGFLIIVTSYLKNLFDNKTVGNKTVGNKTVGNKTVGNKTVDGCCDDHYKKPIRYFECRALPLPTIKMIAKLKGVTVNDFLFSIMVRADYLYYNKRRELVTMTPFSLKNIGKSGDGFNNFIPIQNIIYNNYTNGELLQKTHSVFSAYKYSSYIYLYNQFLCFINHFFLYDICSLYMKGETFVDYIFTNVIGPPLENSHIKDNKFLVNPLNGEFSFNIISSGDKINIVCSLVDASIDIVRFEQCVYDAYKELIL